MSTAINITDLSFSYKLKDKVILDKINLKINKNTTFGIIGPTGAGKSTLLLHLNGLLRGLGSIKINDISINKRNLKQIREMVGIVFQNPDNQLFCPTVYEDVAFGLIQRGLSEDQIKPKVNKILEYFNLLDYSASSSHQLSFGEKKRIALASILIMQPQIICFDEPFANLDYESIYTLIAEIKRLSLTKIIVSQDILLTMAICDHIAVINGGKILLVDTPVNIAHNHLPLLKQNNINFLPYLDLIRKNIIF